jgi:hypothetical protein
MLIALRHWRVNLPAYNLRNFALHAPLLYPNRQPRPPVSEEDRTRRREFKRVNRMLGHIERLIRSTKTSSHASSDVRAKVHTILGRNLSESSTLLAYEKSISLFLKHARWDDAAIIYKRMLSEGYTASRRLQSKILAVTIIGSAREAEAPVESFKASFVRREFDDVCFRQIVLMLTEHSYNADLVEKLTNLYTDSRSADWKPSADYSMVLSDYEARTGECIGALHKEAHERADEPPEISAREQARIHAAVLTDLAHSPSKIKLSRDDVMKRLEEADIQPTESVFNALIRMDINASQVDRAFAFYHAFMANRTRTLLPNVATFLMLFRLSRKIYAPRNRLLRGYKHSASTVPPAQLFRDMMECHLIQTVGVVKNRSQVLDVPVLNAALHMFLALRDYPAAFVVAKVFERCGLRPDARSYRLALHHLVERARRVVGYEAGKIWVEVLLGIGKPSPAARTVMTNWAWYELSERLDPDLSFEDHVATRLLWLGSGTNAPMETTDDITAFMLGHDRKLTTTSSPSTNPPSSSPLPTLFMLSSGEIPLPASFDSLPLRRILFRAVRASAVVGGNHPVTQLIKQAKERLILDQGVLGFNRGAVDRRGLWKVK